MKRRSLRKGTTLMEVLVSLLVLAVSVVMAMAMFTTSRLFRDRSGYYAHATALAQKKQAQLRKLLASQITYTNLLTMGVVDASTNSASGVYSITTIDNLATELPKGSGTLTLTNPASSLVTIDVTINWTGLRGRAESVTVTTYVADRTVWLDPTSS